LGGGPLAYPFDEVAGGGDLGVAEARFYPEFAWIPCRFIQLVSVLQREERIRITMDDEQRDGGDARSYDMRRLGFGVPSSCGDACPPGQAHGEAAYSALYHPVDAAHRNRFAVIPARWGTHGDHCVDASVQGSVPYGHGTA
jgi:hypothetical protein